MSGSPISNTAGSVGQQNASQVAQAISARTVAVHGQEWELGSGRGVSVRDELLEESEHTTKSMFSWLFGAMTFATDHVSESYEEVKKFHQNETPSAGKVCFSFSSISLDVASRCSTNVSEAETYTGSLALAGGAVVFAGLGVGLGVAGLGCQAIGAVTRGVGSMVSAVTESVS